MIVCILKAPKGAFCFDEIRDEIMLKLLETS
jgi:hypothetical protein